MKESQWRSSKTQPYRIAFNTHTHTSHLIEDANGVRQVIKKFSDQETQVFDDYGVPYPDLGRGLNELLRTCAKHELNDSETLGQKHTTEPVVVFDDVNITSASIHCAMYEALLNKLHLNCNPDVYA